MFYMWKVLYTMWLISVVTGILYGLWWLHNDYLLYAAIIAATLIVLYDRLLVSILQWVVKILTRLKKQNEAAINMKNKETKND